MKQTLILIIFCPQWNCFQWTRCNPYRGSNRPVKVDENEIKLKSLLIEISILDFLIATSRCFGATRPGVYDKQRQLFALHFRGLSFYFPVDLQYEPGRSHGLGSLRFPGDSSPVLAKMIIYCGNNAAEAPVPQLPLSCYRGHVYCEECHVLRNGTGTRTLGLRLKLVASSSNILEPTRIQFDREVCFGDSAQTVAAKLGTPSRVFYKAEDKMKIHSRDYHKRVSSERSDYFFNYFTMGLVSFV